MHTAPSWDGCSFLLFHFFLELESILKFVDIALSPTSQICGLRVRTRLGLRKQSNKTRFEQCMSHLECKI